jgi:predicted negative regulator of RcsB-dependent stress response
MVAVLNALSIGPTWAGYVKLSREKYAMKAEHRHGLETNWLAKQLGVWVDQVRPYAAMVAGLVIAVVVVAIGWQLYSGSRSSEKADAWNTYNTAVERPMPDLELLRTASEQYPGTKVKELADVTWADGQVWLASREYIYRRSAAMEALDRARSAYEGVIRSSSDERLVNRARFGIARIYEMQNDLDKAREEYLKVQGGFEDLAKQRAEQLAEEEAKQAYSWLAQAQPPRRPAPMGPGTPGARPDFSAGDLQLPGAPSTGSPGLPAGEEVSLENLFQGLDPDFGAPTTDRYPTGEAPPAEAAGESETAPADQQPTTTDTSEAASEPANDQPPAE